MDNHYTNEEGPNFQFPFLDHFNPQHHIVSETSTSEVVSTVKDIVKGIVDSEAASTIMPTTSMPQIDFNESATDTMVGMQETTTSIINEMFQSNNTGVNPNSTIITEMIGNNNTSIGPMDMTTSDMDLVTDAATTTMETVVTATKSVVKAVSDVITTTTEDHSDVDTSYQHDAIEDKTMYIVLGVILGVLILVLIILVIIYRRFKAKHSRARVYCVTDLNEVSVSSTKEPCPL